MSRPFAFAGEDVAPGSRVTFELPLPDLYTHAPTCMPVQVIHGRRDGPCLLVCAAVHGDELNGIEIVHRLLGRAALRSLRGTLIAVPMVNVYGVINQSRYLPDRRDLNRSFPGLERGSLASRLAHLFMHEVVSKADYGVDLHTGAGHRINLPQIRGDLDDEETLELAKTFGVPVLINANLRDGSLRQAAGEHGVRMLLYEAGEALRFDEVSIRAGVQGIINLMRKLGMLPASRSRKNETPVAPYVARSSAWVRATGSGVFRTRVPLGAHVDADALLGTISDPLGKQSEAVLAGSAGVVVGRTQLPLVLEGEALFHIATFERAGLVAETVQNFNDEHRSDLRSGVEPVVI
ncbi:MAG: succinylglutamate desuccinylase/aspartoacylase family protein [Gammaproteobacteria bacterium]